MATWTSYSIYPFPCGGAGRVRVLLPETVEAVVALVGVDAALVVGSPTHARVDLVPDSTGLEWHTNFYGAIRSEAVVSFFVKEAGVWTAGPVVEGVPLVWAFSGMDFPWVKRWVVDRLQEAALELAPLGSERSIKVSGAFPRDTGGFPIVTVQVDSVAPAGESVGRALSSVGSLPTLRGTNYNLNLSVVAWAETPEDRDDMAVWLGNALECLIQTLPGIGCSEPSANLEESEDFQTLDVPVFLVTAHLNTSRWSLMATPNPPEYGLLSTTTTTNRGGVPLCLEP